MKGLWLALLVVVLYALHQDTWFWRAVQPVVLGFLPVGLFYHVCYTLAVCGVMWLLVKFAWPSHLESGRVNAPRSVAPSPHRPISAEEDAAP